MCCAWSAHDADTRDLRVRVRQGHLCPRDRPRSRPHAGLPRPRHRAPPHPGRPVHARRRDHLADLEAAPEAAHEAVLSVEGGLTELPCIVVPRRRGPPAARPVHHPARPRRSGRRRPRLRVLRRRGDRRRHGGARRAGAEPVFNRIFDRKARPRVCPRRRRKLAESRQPCRASRRLDAGLATPAPFRV